MSRNIERIIAQAELTNATVLDLSGRNLTSIPESVGNLTGLEKLYLDKNQLSELPESIGNLTGLETLYLDNNELSELPESIGNLTGLETLYLHNNQLSELPESIGNLTGLEMLFLSNNQLSELPESIGNLTGLKALHLFNNQLLELPDIGNLTGLETLDISENQLSELPESIGNLTGLKKLYWRDNPLKSPRPEILELGAHGIVKHFQELQKEHVLRYEAKLLLLGDGNEGKTCVSRALRGLPFEHQPTTRGVDIVPWEFEINDQLTSKAIDVTLKIWDFEGQEIHHQTNQFFLTDDSICILVFKCREQFRLDRAEYWLNTIRSRAPKSKVFMVITECEKRTPSIPLSKLKNDYSDLFQDDQWCFQVDCLSTIGIENLRSALQKTSLSLPNMGEPWPTVYSDCEREISNLRTDAGAEVSCITRVKLQEVFENNEIDPENYSNLAKTMSYMSVVTEFPDCPGLQDFIVTQPQWLAKAISKAMEAKSLMADYGIISHTALGDIWKADYPGMYPVFHECMKEFELLYDLESIASSLVPLRFSDNKPSIPWSIQEYKERRMYYQLDVRPPYGLMSRFIVKTHSMIAKTKELSNGVFWHNGVFLERTDAGQFKSEALCEFDEETKTLQICVRAAYPQSMLEYLHGVVIAVFDFYKGLVPKRSFGCIRVEDQVEIACSGKHDEIAILFCIKNNLELQCTAGEVPHTTDPFVLKSDFASFGNLLVKDRHYVVLRNALDKKPKWAEEQFDNLLNEVQLSRDQQNQLKPETIQKIAMLLRNHLNDINVMLDNRDFLPAPTVVSILPKVQINWNPKNWFQASYVLTPYCEHEHGMHRVESGCVEFKTSKEWWAKSSPAILVGLKLLAQGLSLMYVGLPFATTPDELNEVKNQVSFLKILSLEASKLEFEGKRDKELHFTQNDMSIDEMKSKFGNDYIQKSRHGLVELFRRIAPAQYENRQWGELKRIMMPDNSYRWLCKEHAKEVR